MPGKMLTCTWAPTVFAGSQVASTNRRGGFPDGRALNAAVLPMLARIEALGVSHLLIAQRWWGSGVEMESSSLDCLAMTALFAAHTERIRLVSERPAGQRDAKFGSPSTPPRWCAAPVQNRQFGGFTGVYWRPSEVSKQAGVWFQEDADGNIELVFRLHVTNRQWQRARLRNWHDAIMSVGGGSVAKPARLVAGEYMTVAIWTTDAVAFGEDGRFDFSGTVQNLRKAERVLKEASLQLTTH